MSKTVKCINPKTYNLTRNKEYETVAEENGVYIMFNDRGLRAKYNTSLFEDVVTQLSDQEIFNSYNVNWEEGTITINNRDNEVLNLHYDNDEHANNYLDDLDDQRSFASCGIRAVHGINRLYNSIVELVNEFQFDNNELKSNLIRKIFADHVKMYVLKYCIDTGAFTLFSTNITNDGTDENTSDQAVEDIISILDSYSDCTEQGVNPNSDNEIKIWVIKNENFNR